MSSPTPPAPRPASPPIVADPGALLASLVEGASAIISVKDRDGRYLLVNDAFAQLTGLPRERIVGRTAHEVHPKSVADTLREQDEAVWQSGRRETYELSLPAGRAMRQLLFEKYLLRNERGEPTGVCAVGMDITELRHAQAMMSEKARLLQLAFDAILTWRIGGGIERWNRGAELLYGYTEQEARGRNPHELLQTRFPVSLEATEEALMDTGQWSGELVHRTQVGEWVTVASRLQLYRGNDGIDRVLEINRDITESKAAQRALDERQRDLRRTQLRLEAALAAGGMGVWELVPDTDEAVWYGPTYEMLGLGQGTAQTSRGAQFREFIHPEDRDKIDALLQRAAGDGDEFAADYRVILPDGQTRWLGTRGRYLAGDAQGPGRFIGVNFDITERKAVEQALRETDQRRNEFLAMLAHELRNPLAPITNAVALLERAGHRPELLDKATQIIHRQAAHLARLVDDLLEVSRVTRGRIELRREPMRLDAAVQAAVETARPLMIEQRQTLTVDVPPDLELEADPARIVQIVANLLNNASKYTPEGGHVEVSAQAVGEGQLEIVVRDNGIGMDAELIARVFDLFTQGTRALDRARGGLGIGLALVKSLVELHGGSVRAFSEGPGQGSVFTVRLPRRERRSAPRTSPEVSRERLAPTTLLIADDNRDAADSLAMLLRADGHEVHLAYDGPSAIALARAKRPRVALLDLGMPGLSGYEVVQALRAAPELAGLVAIALSGYGQLSDRERSAQAGFDAHLLKPADLGELYQAIARVEQRA